MEKKDIIWIILISVIFLILAGLALPFFIKTISAGPAQQNPRTVPTPATTTARAWTAGATGTQPMC